MPSLYNYFDNLFEFLYFNQLIISTYIIIRQGLAPDRIIKYLLGKINTFYCAFHLL